MDIALPGARAAAVAFIRGPGAPTNPTQAETTALLAAMTVQPNAARQNLINNLIFDLKAAGVWTTFDLLYVPAAHDAQAGRLNWITPAQALSVNGVPAFTVDRGYKGDGVSAYLGTGINISALVKFVQDNACMGLWTQNDAIDAAPLLGSPTTARVTMNPKANATNMQSRLNNTTASSAAMSASTGHTLATRIAATGYDIYKNAALISSPVVTSTTRATEELMFSRGTTTFNAAHILAAAHIGSALNATQIAALYNALSAYMSGVGA